jgi:hypothetical protein
MAPHPDENADHGMERSTGLTFLRTRHVVEVLPNAELFLISGVGLNPARRGA